MRAFGGGTRSNFDIRRLIRGDSIWIRILTYLVMSAIFLLLVTLTKRAGVRSADQAKESATTADSTGVRVTQPRAQFGVKPAK